MYATWLFVYIKKRVYRDEAVKRATFFPYKPTLPREYTFAIPCISLSVYAWVLCVGALDEGSFLYRHLIKGLYIAGLSCAQMNYTAVCAEVCFVVLCCRRCYIYTCLNYLRANALTTFTLSLAHSMSDDLQPNYLYAPLNKRCWRILAEPSGDAVSYN